MTSEFIAAIDRLAARSLIIVGGKGGVGKTTVATLAAMRIAQSKHAVLFSSDPASNLHDLFGEISIDQLIVDHVEAADLYRRFLDRNLESFLELGDRGTYLDREELRRFFELAVPGIDELMAWMHIGDLVAANAEATVIVDSAPTGHSLRMLRSSEQFHRFGEALESMQGKHRALVQQLTRRRVRDAIDAFIDDFQRDARERAALLADHQMTAFVPVFVAEPWIVSQTRRLATEVRQQGIDVPLLILNRSAENCDCRRCGERVQRERAARDSFAGEQIVSLPQACTPLGDVRALQRILEHSSAPKPAPQSGAVVSRSRPGIRVDPTFRALFVAGKGGVGKTTVAASIALQLAAEGRRTTVLSIDPAHGLRDALQDIDAANLKIEFIDTPAAWDRLRQEIGDEVDNALSALTPQGLHIAHDGEVMRQLIDIAPPGADELFAIIRLHDLLFDEERPDVVIVDTAPTGHFLRLLELPKTAAGWVREFMRVLLRYSELIPAGQLGSQLVRASRALTAFDAALRSDQTAAVVVTRPETLVLTETLRLMDQLSLHDMRVAGVIVNYVAPDNDCPCDAQRRLSEEEALAGFEGASGPIAAIIEEQDSPVTGAERLRALVPVVLTSG